MQLDFGQIIEGYNDEEAIHHNDKIEENNQNLESEIKTILEAQSKQLTIQKKLKYLSRLRVSFRELSRMNNTLVCFICSILILEQCCSQFWCGSC